MKTIVMIVIAFYSSIAFCLEIPFSEKSAKLYYSNVETIFLGLKLSGPLSFDAFSKSMKEYSVFDEKTLRDLWEIQPKESKYLIIKVYKGNPVSERSIIDITHSDELTFPKIGSLYFLFSDKNKFVGWCNAFSADAIPKNKFHLMLHANYEDLINYLLESKAHYCLNSPKIRLEK